MQMRTEWSALLREHQPRFSEDSAVELPSLKPSLLPDNSALKASFAFDHEHHVTPWLSLASGDGVFLNALRFTLTYSGDHITQVRWELDYNDTPVHHSEWPKTLWLSYTWVPAAQQDATTGLNLLFLGGFIMSMALVVCTVMSSASLMEDEGDVVLQERPRESARHMRGKGAHRD